MEMIDMRKLSPEARQERRHRVIKLRQAGWTYEAIGADLGLSRTGVFDICKRFDAGGAKALVDKPTGRPVGNAIKLRRHTQSDSLFSVLFCLT